MKITNKAYYLLMEARELSWAWFSSKQMFFFVEILYRRKLFLSFYVYICLLQEICVGAYMCPGTCHLILVVMCTRSNCFLLLLILNNMFRLLRVSVSLLHNSCLQILFMVNETRTLFGQNIDNLKQFSLLMSIK